MKQNLYKDHWQNPEFVKTFKAFKDFTIEYEQECMMKCATAIQKILLKDSISVLDIGIGDGSVAFSLIQELKRYYSLEKYVGIDISPEQIELATSALENFSNELNIKLSTVDAQIYQPDFTPDLIVALNAWYGISFDHINVVRSFLSDGGVLAILLNSELNLTIDVTNTFKDDESVTSSEQLMEWLGDNDITYESVLVTSDTFDSDRFLSDGKIHNKALDFLTYILRGDLSKIDQITEYIQNKPDTYFNLPQHLVLISK